jgi:pimeloyl-ACP methyl ester carboxylesterase
MLTAPWAGSAAGRRAAAALLADLPGATPGEPLGGAWTLLLWGDEDPLYPPLVADRLAATQARVERQTIPGGDHFHPLERPWAFADLLHASWPVERPAERATG